MQNVPTPPNIYSRKVIYWKCIRKGRMPKHYAKFGFFLLPRNYLVVWAIVIRNECFMILLINYDQYIYKVSKKNTSFSFELHVNIEQLITQINKEKNSYSAFTIFARHQHIRLPLTFSQNTSEKQPLPAVLFSWKQSLRTIWLVIVTCKGMLVLCINLIIVSVTI